MAHKKTYTLGKGRLMVRPDKADGSKGDGFVDFGNCPEMNLTLETEKLDHFSSRSGLQLKDLSLITKVSAMLAFTLDEPDYELLARYFMSAQTDEGIQSAIVKPTVPAPPVIGTADLTNVATEGYTDGTDQRARIKVIDLGIWIPLHAWDGANGVTLARMNKLTGFELWDETAGVPTNKLVEGGYTKPQTGHYELDAAAGLIYFHKVQPATNALAKDDLLYGFTGASAIATGDDAMKKNYGYTTTQFKGHLYFVGNPPQGQAIDVEAYCSITPTGDFNLISDEWMQFQFEAECLEHADYQDAAGNQGLFRITNRTQIG